MRISFIFLVLIPLLIFSGCGTQEDDNQLAPQTGNEFRTQGESSLEAEASHGNAEGLDAEPLMTTIKPGPNALKEAQEALILAQPGDVIEFAEGTFEFTGTLTLDNVDDITIRGQGIEKTILDFSKQHKAAGGEGIKVISNNFIIENLTVQNTPGDAIKINESTGVTFRRVRAWWSNGPDKNNGAYGLYPVLCKNVLIEHCVAECASDAGIYVGQSEQTIVRYNRASENVAGIEIENTIGADVYENEAVGNTGGLLVFSLPGLTIKNGRQTRLFKNKVHDNNLANFAPKGAAVSGVPAGTGVMVMANNDVEIFENDIHNNKTANCAIISFQDTKKKKGDPGYDRYPEGIYIHDNRFAEGGTEPEGELAGLYAKTVGVPIPDIVFDGLIDPEKLVDGKLPDELGIRISNNGDATFVNLNLKKVLEGGEPQFITDMSSYEGRIGPLPAVSIPEVE